MIELSDKYKSENEYIIPEAPVKKRSKKGSGASDSEEGNSQEKNPGKTMMLTLLIAS